MGEAPGLGAIRFDPSITPEQQAEISRRLGVSGNLGTDYMKQQRQEVGQQAGNDLLARYGLDATGNPMQQEPGATPAAAPAPSNNVQRAAGSADRIKKIKADQAKEPQPSFMRDVVGGTAAEIPRAVVGGVRDAVKEMLESVDSLAGFFAEKTGTQKGGAFGKAAGAIPKMVDDTTTPGGKLLQGIVQFATGYATGGKALKAAGVAGKVTKPLLAGAFADMAAFDPNDPTISNLINETVPALKTPLTEFLATDAKDGEALNRFKRTVEGLGLGVATEAVISVARGWRASRAVARTEQAFEQAKAQPAAVEAPAAAIPEPSTVAPGPSAASQVDIVRPPENAIDIPVGQSGQGGVMQSERLALPAPGKFTLTADEIAENLMRERKSRMAMEGNPTLRAAQESATIKNEVIGNPTLRAAYETSLKGESEEAIIESLVKKAKPELEAVAKEVFTSAKEAPEVSAEVMARGQAFLNQSGEIKPEALHAIARAAVGGALGLSQGDTMEERIANAVVGMGVGAALKPSLLKKLVGAMQNAAPREMKIAKSFDPPTLDVTAKGVGRRPPKEMGPVTVASEAQAKDFLAADPTAIQVGNKAIKINWSEIGSQEQIDDTIKTLTKLNEESIDVARRGVQHDDNRRALANMLGVTEDDMLRRRRGQALNSEQTQAFIDVYGSAVKELDRLAVALKSGEQVENQFRMQLGRTTALTETVFGARAEAGRALRIWGQAGQEINRIGGVQQQVDMLKLSGKSVEDVPADRLADMILALQDPAQKATFLQHAMKLGNSAVLEAWMNGLLSNPVTHAANIVSNSATTFMGIAERAIAGTFGKEVARGEATAMMKGVIGGWREALELGKRSFIAGESQLGFSKLETHGRAISAENLGLSGQMGKAVDWLGAVVSTPGRALMAADDFFKGLNYRAEMSGLGWRQATKEGFQGDALTKRALELAQDTDFASMVKDQAENYAFYQTFNSELGRLGEGYLGFMTDHPWARVVTPFVRTPVNIAKYTLERTPLVNLAMNQVRSDLAAGGAKRELALAKMATGSMLFGTASTLAMGGYITGGGPKNKDLRNTKRLTGWQPYSFKFGDTYVSYSRLDPLGFLFGLGADIVEKGGELQNTEIDDLATAGMMALHDTFINKTYMSGLMHIVDALESPDRMMTKYFQNLSGSIVPAGIANLNRQFDPTLKEVNSAADAIFSRLPGFGSDMPPRRNLWGEPITLEGAIGPDMVSPFYTSTKKDDPVADEILRLEMPVKMWPKYIYGSRPTDNAFANPDPHRGVKLLPEEYDRFVQLAGDELKLGGTNIYERLDKTISSSQYARLPEMQKKTIIQQIFDKYREGAEIQTIKEFPDLQAEIAAKDQERREAMMPQ